MGRLEGKVAVVTGANSGIGLATAKRFAREGARVFMVGRRKAELDAAVQEVGANARGVQADVSTIADLDRLYGVVKQEAGHIDVLFANAGVGDTMALPDITEEHFDRIFATNVKGTLFTVQKALPLLRDGASVILTGSTTGSKGTPAFSVYSASKAAIRNFARSWILDLATRKISRERFVAWRHIDARPARPGDVGSRETGAGEIARGGHAARSPGRSRRNRGRRSLPCFRRQQLRHRQRTVCGWRDGSGLTWRLSQRRSTYRLA